MTAEPTAIEGTKDELVRDFRAVVVNGDALMDRLGNSSAEQRVAARTKFATELRTASTALDNARISVTEKAKDAAGATHEYVRENPWKVLGVAAVTGLVIGFVFSRR